MCLYCCASTLNSRIGPKHSIMLLLNDLRGKAKKGKEIPQRRRKRNKEKNQVPRKARIVRMIPKSRNSHRSCRKNWNSLSSHPQLHDDHVTAAFIMNRCDGDQRPKLHLLFGCDRCHLLHLIPHQGVVGTTQTNHPSEELAGQLWLKLLGGRYWRI